METKLTFTQKLAGALGAVVLLSVAVALIAAFALREVVRSKDHVLETAALRLVDTERLRTLSVAKANEARDYIISKNPLALQRLRDVRAELRSLLDRLRGEVETDEGRRQIEEIARTDEAHSQAVDVLLAFAATPGASLEAISARLERDVRSQRVALDRATDAFVAREAKLLNDDRQESTDAANRAIRLVLGLAAASVLLAVALALLLQRALSRQISTAVRHVQSSSAELQATAGQQATGAKQQATAMAEITTTISELLATSRQISESAQRVAAIAGETASAARAGDQTVQRSQESIGTIRRQVDLVVNHMLELGRKSQQIGGILDVITELAEQTNILAINATIEAAGAGEGGRRFAVVAEEIRKLADRVAGSTKDIRTLIDEVRSAVNTTVMATEGGSKSVEAGARQFSDVAAAFGHIARLVGTTTDAAREIELSTKQQATAVEQVNVAISNVAQATREAEASSGQALQTAAQLATMSRDLARLVQTARAA